MIDFLLGLFGCMFVSLLVCLFVCPFVCLSVCPSFAPFSSFGQLLFYADKRIVNVVKV